jgi:hypothetical protein
MVKHLQVQFFQMKHLRVQFLQVKHLRVQFLSSVPPGEAPSGVVSPGVDVWG